MSTLLLSKKEISESIATPGHEIVESFLYDRVRVLRPEDVRFMQRTSCDLRLTNMQIAGALPTGYRFVISSIRLAVTDPGGYSLDPLVRSLQDSAILELSICNRIFIQTPVLLLYNYVEINPEIRRSVVFHYNLEDPHLRSMPLIIGHEPFRPLLRSLPLLGSEYELLLSMYGYLIRPTC